MTDVDLLYTDVEDDLRASVRDLLARRCTPTALIALYDGDRAPVAPLWRELASDLGLAALLVPEELGGAGASPAVAGVVLEELGRAAAPVPFLTSAVIATAALLPGVEGEAAGGLLAVLAEGERTAALAVPFSAGPASPVRAVAVDGGRLTGSVRSVAGALEADVLLVLGDDGVLYSVPAGDDAVEVAPVVSLDMTRALADVTFSGAPGEQVVADGGPAVSGALELGAALLASEQAGVAQWCLETTVGYLKERRQFGRVVGGFQALKHRLADLFTSVECTSAAARYAAVVSGTDDAGERAIAAAVAQAYASDVAVTAAEEAVQLHGGIGMTWEHPAHLYLKRAKADQIGLGTGGAHRARLADLVDLPA